MGRSISTLNGYPSLDGLNLIRGGAKNDGQIKPLLANVVTVLKASQEYFNLCYDDFSQKPYRGKARLTDADFLDITNWIQRAGVHADVRIVTNGILHVAQECRFHQVRDYLDPLVWDGLPRLDQIFVRLAGALDVPAVHTMSRKWHVQTVARAYEAGCQADCMLILMGRQGLRKSSYFRIMGSPWFTDHLSDITSKDAKQELRGMWVIEMAEMNTMRRHEIGQLKSFMTTTVDHYRDSYGRTTDDFPRQCTFAGTYNPSGTGLFKDPTGARRFWPLSIDKEINMEIVRAERDQLWAEAVFRYKDGETWHIDDDVTLAAVQDIQAEYRETDIWEDEIAKFISTRDEVTIQNILTNCLYVGKVADFGKPEQMRVGDVLSQLRWDRKRRTGGTREYYFVRSQYADQAKTPGLGGTAQGGTDEVGRELFI